VAEQILAGFDVEQRVNDAAVAKIVLG
jgi:hypothetical protein